MNELKSTADLRPYFGHTTPSRQDRMRFQPQSKPTLRVMGIAVDNSPCRQRLGSDPDTALWENTCRRLRHLASLPACGTSTPPGVSGPIADCETIGNGWSATRKLSSGRRHTSTEGRPIGR